MGQHLFDQLLVVVVVTILTGTNPQTLAEKEFDKLDFAKHEGLDQKAFLIDIVSHGPEVLEALESAILDRGFEEFLE